MRSSFHRSSSQSGVTVTPGPSSRLSYFGSVSPFVPGASQAPQTDSLARQRLRHSDLRLTSNQLEQTPNSVTHVWLSHNGSDKWVAGCRIKSGSFYTNDQWDLKTYGSSTLFGCIPTGVSCQVAQPGGDNHQRRQYFLDAVAQKGGAGEVGAGVIVLTKHPQRGDAELRSLLSIGR